MICNIINVIASQKNTCCITLTSLDLEEGEDATGGTGRSEHRIECRTVSAGNKPGNILKNGYAHIFT